MDVVGRGPGEDRIERPCRALRVASEFGLDDVGDGDELRVLGGGDGLLDLEALDAIGAQFGGGVTLRAWRPAGLRRTALRLGLRGIRWWC